MNNPVFARNQRGHSVVLWSHFRFSTERTIKNVLKSLEKIEKQNCSYYEAEEVTTELRNTELFASHMKPFKYRSLSVSTINTIHQLQFTLLFRGLISSETGRT